MNTPAVGVIGVGAMGLPVAVRLLRRGFAVATRDIRPEADAAAAAAGARVCASPGDLARVCDVVVVLVVDAAQIDTVLTGPEGLLPALSARHVVLLCSTIGPSDATRLGATIEAYGAGALDAPISGGPARATAGELAMMLAGSDGAVGRARPVVDAMATRVFRIGTALGDGAKVKLVNNLLAGVNLVAGAEALSLGARLGLDARQLLDVIAASSGQSWIVTDRMSRALAGDFAPRAAVHILTKDMTLALAAASEAGVEPLLGPPALEVFRRTLDAGYRDEDDAAVLKVVGDPDTCGTAAATSVPTTVAASRERN